MPYRKFAVDGIGEVTVYKRRGNRSLRLSIASDGSVRVSIPFWTPYQTGLAFMMSRKAWVMAQARPTTKALYNGMAVGKTRRLRFVRDLTGSGVKTSVRSNEVVVTFGPRLTVDSESVQQAATNACWRALKAESVKLLAPRLSQLAALHGFTYRSISVKRMKTRWGSCDQRQNIVLNLFLVQLPWECIDYVILHELTHTRVLSHGPNFWSAMETVLPHAKSFRRQMRAYHPALIVE